MNPQNKKFLDDNERHYLTVKDGYVKGLNAAEREGMQRVMAEEFAPGYSTDLWCGPCVFEMVKLLYTRYEQWKSQQPKENPTPVETPMVEAVHATFPKADPPGISEIANVPIEKSNKQTNEQHSSNGNHSSKHHHRRR